MKQPKLRFPEFTGDWKQHKFEDVVTIGSGKDYKHLESGNVPVYGTGGYMLSVNQALSENEDAVGIGRKGTIDKPYILRAPFWTVDTLFYCIPNKGFDLTFTNCLFQNVDWKRKDESTGVPSLSKVIINNVKTYVPSLEEQQKIASLFTEIDTLIQSAEKELDGYRELKQGMLQKMFPKKGEKVPEIRFPEFTGDWEQHRFSELVLIERGGSPRPINAFITKEASGLNWVKIGDAPTQGRFITKTAEKIKPEGLSKTREVHPGDLILSNSMSFGKPYIMGINGCIHDGWLLIRDVQKRFDLKFLCNMLSTEQMLAQYKSLAAGSAVNNLNKELVGNTIVTIPSIEEQRILGDYFENLDNLIISQQQELDGYKELKKGLLQQMFC